MLENTDQKKLRIWINYTQFSQISKMELFAKIVMDFELLTIFAKSSISDVRLGSKYASDIHSEKVFLIH